MYTLFLFIKERKLVFFDETIKKSKEKGSKEKGISKK